MNNLCVKLMADLPIGPSVPPLFALIGPGSFLLEGRLVLLFPETSER